MRTLTLRRHGSFHVKLKGGVHCGRDLGNAKLGMSYSVMVECAPELDKRGFLFDQIRVDEVFQKLGETALSCELLAEHCAKKVLAAIRSDNPRCAVRCIEVNISAEPHAANMTYFDDFGNEVRRRAA